MLQQQGVNRLSALILPAADAPHAGGALDILAAFRVKELWCAATNSRSPVFREVLATARARRIPIRVMSDGGRVMLGDRLECQYLAASKMLLVRCREPADPPSASSSVAGNGAAAIKIGWGRAGSVQNAPETRSARRGRDEPPDTVTIERRAPGGLPAALRVRCVEPGEAAAEPNGIDGESWIGLAPGQGVRIYLDAPRCCVEPLGGR